MKARDMNRALYAHFSQRYAVITEITVRESAATGGHPWPRDRRCDVLLYSTKERIAIEVKVARADLLADVADPSKQEAWARITHRQAYAVPAPLLECALERVPPEFGVLVVTPPPETASPNVYTSVRWARRAPKHLQEVPVPYGKPLKVERTPEDLPARVWASLAYRLAQLEANAKGYGWRSHEGSDDAAELRTRIERLQRDLQIAHSQKDEANRRAEDWRKAYGQGNPVPCETCGEILSPKRGRYAGDWEHRDATHEAICLAIRTAEAEANKDRWYRGHVPPPQPLYLTPDTLKVVT